MIQEKIAEKGDQSPVEHSLLIELFDYQIKTVNWLLESRKKEIPSFLCHERGLARKTQILVYLEVIDGCSAIIVHQKDIYHWMDVLNRSKKLDYFLHSGKSEKSYDLNKYKVIYGTRTLKNIC